MRNAIALSVFIVVTNALAQPGTPDPSFDVGAGPNYWVYGLIQQPNGKILMAGGFDDANGTACDGIIRLNIDGTVDPGFTPGTGTWNDVLCMALQPDGRIVVGSNTPGHFIERLEPDGVLDAGFANGAGPNAPLTQIIVQPDARILITGEFTTYDGVARDGIARLEADGSLDLSFDPGSGVGGNGIQAMALQSDGKVMIGGNFTTYDGTGRNKIARVNADGSLDTSFDPGSGVSAGSVLAIAVQADGKVLAGGSMFDYNGTMVPRIMRILADGQIDPDFDPGTGATGIAATVQCIQLLPEGKALIGGSFTGYAGASATRYARILNDGSPDPTFMNSAFGADERVLCAALQSDGQLLIGGEFSMLGTEAHPHVARLINCLISSSLITATACDSYTLNGENYTSTGIYTQTIPNLSGCDSTITLDLTITPVNASVTDLSTTLTATPAGAQYQWLDCNNGNAPIAGATGQSFTPAQNGSYAVTVTVGGCSETTACTNVTSVGVDELARSSAFVLAPNPSNGSFTLVLDEPIVEATIEIVDAAGRVVHTETVIRSTSRVSFDLQCVLAPGAYAIHIRQHEQQLVGRVLITQ